MKTGLRLFLGSAVFGIVIAVVYYFSSYHLGGTILLALLGTALMFVTGYTFLAERDARLLGDRANATIQEGQGERVGTFTLESSWPFITACAAWLTAIGLATSFPFLTTIGIIGIAYSIYRMMKESE